MRPVLGTWLWSLMRPSFPWGAQSPGGTQKQTGVPENTVLQGGAGFWRLRSPPQIYLPEERRMKSKPGGSQMAGRAGRGFCSKVPRMRVFPRRGHGLIWILEGIGGKHAFKKHEVGRGWRGSRAGHGKSHEGQLRASSSSWQGLIGSLGVTWSDLDFRKITLTTGWMKGRQGQV